MGVNAPERRSCRKKGFAVELHKKDCIVSGVEPNEEANQIVLLRAKETGIAVEGFTTHKVEALPFGDNTFDFIYTDESGDSYPQKT